MNTSNTVSVALQQAYAALEQGQLPQAERLCRAALAAHPENFHAWTLLGVVAGQAGRHDAAVTCFARAAALQPSNPAAHFVHAKSLRDAGQPEDALAAYDRSLSLDAAQAAAHNNRGNVLASLGRHEEACSAFERALALSPDMAEALGNLGLSLYQVGRHEEAVRACEDALASGAPSADVAITLGNALRTLGRLPNALAAYDQAIALDVSRAEAHNNRAVTLFSLDRLEEAREGFEQALSRDPSLTEAAFALGDVLHRLGRHGEALDAFSRVIRVDPLHRRACFAMGGVLRFLGRHAQALGVFDEALKVDPDDVLALENRGACLLSLQRPAEAATAFARLHALSPSYPFAVGLLLHARMLCCDWEGLDELVREGVEAQASGRDSVEPFGFQAVGADPAVLQQCAQRYANRYYPPRQADLPEPKPSGRKIRIGYSSGEFRHQATSILMAEVLELHDKQRFEVVAFDNGFDDNSELRRRIVASVDDLVDISRMGDLQAAAAIRERGIDILVNLNGYFGLRRQEVFAMRAAPIQVNYLGFPGTLGAPYMDYIVADRVVIPDEDRRFYDEQVVWLPECYQANDRKRPISPRRFTREEAGLPAEGFVFCCFNNTYKILPAIFDAWMRILARVPGSVLWLYQANAEAAANLRREAVTRGIAAERIVFGPPLPLPEHLARLRLADLCIDTLPYNAHTTASDALWAGLPVLTCRGRTFPARVGSSLLHAIGLPELITENLAGYEALAIRLAIHPGALAGIRAKLEGQRLIAPLFDSERFTRHLEAAFAMMAARREQGLAPAHFAVPPRS